MGGIAGRADLWGGGGVRGGMVYNIQIKKFYTYIHLLLYIEKYKYILYISLYRNRVLTIRKTYILRNVDNVSRVYGISSHIPQPDPAFCLRTAYNVKGPRHLIARLYFQSMPGPLP